MSTREKDSAKLSEGGDRWIKLAFTRRAEAAVLRAGAHTSDSHVSDRSSTRNPVMQMHDHQPLAPIRLVRLDASRYLRPYTDLPRRQPQQREPLASTFPQPSKRARSTRMRPKKNGYLMLCISCQATATKGIPSLRLTRVRNGHCSLHMRMQ